MGEDIDKKPDYFRTVYFLVIGLLMIWISSKVILKDIFEVKIYHVICFMFFLIGCYLIINAPTDRND